MKNELILDWLKEYFSNASDKIGSKNEKLMKHRMLEDRAIQNLLDLKHSLKETGL